MNLESELELTRIEAELAAGRAVIFLQAARLYMSSFPCRLPDHPYMPNHTVKSLSRNPHIFYIGMIPNDTVKSLSRNPHIFYLCIRYRKVQPARK